MNSEQLYMDMADRLAADGYREAGYVYVNIDDCWASKQRDPQTMQLVADPQRFPNGIKHLADYVSSICGIRWINKLDFCKNVWWIMKCIMLWLGAFFFSFAHLQPSINDFKESCSQLEVIDISVEFDSTMHDKIYV